MATRKPQALSATQKKQRDELAARFAVAIAGATVIFEVLDKTDGAFTSQVNRVAIEMANNFMKKTEAA